MAGIGGQRVKFRDDIDPETTWVVSDTHFGHKNIIEWARRPPDVEQMMMESWAREVPPEATVLHLGDLAYSNNAWFKNMIAPHLTGERKLLVKGNHDRGRFSFYKGSGFDIVRPFAIEWGQDVISFSHYPWNAVEDGEMPPGTWRVHGHIHNNGYTRDAFVPFLLNHINISVEQTQYRPVNLELLLKGAIYGEF